MKRFRKQLIAFLIIIGLILLNRWIFATFLETDYLLWYINNGTFIGVGISFISLVSENFKKDVNAISADPLVYIASYLRYLAMPFLTIGTDMRLASGLVKIADDSPLDDIEVVSELSTPPDSSPGCLHLLFSTFWNLIDSLLSLIWMFILTVTILLWVIVIIPIQYFVFLICGSAARILSTSDYRAVATTEGRTLIINYIKKSKETPSGWWNASIAAEPFTLTNLLSVLFFAVLKYFLL